MSESMLDSDKLLTMKETLDYLHIGRTTMYTLMQSGQIQGYKVRSTWRFYLRDVRALVNGGKMSIARKAVTNKLEQRRE